MTILFMASAKLRDTSMFSDDGCVISSTYARTGTYSFKSAYGDNTSIVIPSTTEGYFRIATLSSGYYRLYMFEATNNAQLTITIAPDRVTLHRGSMATLLASGVVVSARNTFNIVEAHWLINNTTGVCQVKVNGELLIDYSGDTYTSGNTSIYKFYIDQATLVDVYFDDVIIRTDTWPGRGSIDVLVPNAGSTTENWTASTGDPETCVDDIPPSFTDYVSTNALVDNTEQLFGITSLPTTSNTINAVGVVVKAKLDYPTTSSLATLLKASGTTAVGTSVGLDTTEKLATAYYDLNPADSAAFEDADIDALEVGMETVV